MILIPANLIQVSYGASTHRLDNKDEYTNFLRTQPTHTRLATNVAQVLKNLTYSNMADINSVVQIYTSSHFGSDGAKVRKTMCVKYKSYYTRVL